MLNPSEIPSLGFTLLGLFWSVLKKECPLAWNKQGWNEALNLHPSQDHTKLLFVQITYEIYLFYNNAETSYITR